MRVISTNRTGHFICFVRAVSTVCFDNKIYIVCTMCTILPIRAAHAIINVRDIDDLNSILSSRAVSYVCDVHGITATFMIRAIRFVYDVCDVRAQSAISVICNNRNFHGVGDGCAARVLRCVCTFRIFHALNVASESKRVRKLQCLIKLSGPYVLQCIQFVLHLFSSDIRINFCLQLVGAICADCPSRS